MFFHGIDFKYLLLQYPCLFPDAHVSKKSKTQLEDRLHLIQRFGFEPVHLLEATDTFPIDKCVQECLSFGEVVFAFQHLNAPIWQISEHEIGVSYLNVKMCSFIVLRSERHKDKVRQIMTDKRIFTFNGSLPLVELLDRKV